jgi:RNA polymerase sigma-70 factor (ECF subfamily)
LTPADEGKIEPPIVAALYVQHADELRRFLLGVLRDPQLASDVLQTTFMRLVEGGHRTREETRKAWLFRVAYNEALALRRRQATGDRVTRQSAWSRPAAGQAAEEPLLQFERVETVRQALERLPKQQREVVRMRIYQEKTFAAIAQELGIPLGTALSRMRAAMSKLRQSLEPE